VPEKDAELNGIRALVVDDNPTNRYVLKETLIRWNMRPAAASSGAEAVDMLRGALEQRDPFSLILTDLMLSSGENQGHIELCRSMGFAVYLTKPVARVDLRAAIVAALGISPKHQEPSQAAIADSRPRPLGCGLRILLAEDNCVNQRVALRILEKEGHNVTVVGNGREALKALAESEFDLVLMDVQMPEMDGFEATAAVRRAELATKRHLPIVAMTAHAMTGDRERCLAAGMDEYISKPIRAQLVLDIIEKYSSFARSRH
jgi:CheY-like chemotaxis protein